MSEGFVPFSTASMNEVTSEMVFFTPSGLRLPATIQPVSMSIRYTCTVHSDRFPAAPSTNLMRQSLRVRLVMFCQKSCSCFEWRMGFEEGLEGLPWLSTAIPSGLSDRWAIGKTGTAEFYRCYLKLSVFDNLW